MKNLKLMTIAMLLFFASIATNAQVSVNVNIGTPPIWAPVVSPSVEYYYIPDVQSYYDVRASKFIYLSNGVWIRSGYLPKQYRNYDLNRGYKVVLNDYHGSRPYDNYRYDRVKYYKGYKGGSQKVVVQKTSNHNNKDNNGNSNKHVAKHENKGKENKHGH